MKNFFLVILLVFGSKNLFSAREEQEEEREKISDAARQRVIGIWQAMKESTPFSTDIAATTIEYCGKVEEPTKWTLHTVVFMGMRWRFPSRELSFDNSVKCMKLKTGSAVYSQGVYSKRAGAFFNYQGDFFIVPKELFVGFNGSGKDSFWRWQKYTYLSAKAQPFQVGAVVQLLEADELERVKGCR